VIRVAIVDDHPVVRDGIAANLADGDGIAVIGMAADAAGAVALAQRDRPDVMLLDLELPDGSGLDAIVDVKAASPSTRIVVFSAYGGEERVSTALSRGADSYVLKGTASDELLAAVRAAAAGESRLAGDVAAQLVASLRAPRSIRLTPREREILRLVADGLSNKAIATRLGISERTAKYHVGEILGRLGAENRAQAVAIANRRGLL
jgi:two-component system, NarL family, response regulator LiaR